MNYVVISAEKMPRGNGPMCMDRLLELYKISPEQVVNISPYGYRYYQNGSVSVSSYIIFYRRKVESF